MAPVDRVAPEERLLNLFIALTSTRVRLDKQQIRTTVHGYDGRQAGEDAKADAAFERMFERDKDDLRQLGVPLQTVTDPANGGDIGYQIDASAATMEPIELTPAELAVVSLAADYWRDAALGPDARQAVTKVASGVLHEPIHSFCLSPDFPSVSACFQTSLPVFLSKAFNAVRSPGPQFRMTRSFQRIGDEALPQMWISGPSSAFQSSLPVKS